MDVDERVSLDWPRERTCYLTLDLECDFGTALSENTYAAHEYVPQLVTLLETHDVPLTCFVQTEVLDEVPSSVDKLREAAVDVSFHPHSHTHAKRGETSIPWEIETSTERFQEYFGERPTGYRLPDGNVRPPDYEALAEHGYAFDASVFPTWRPGRFDNRSASIRPSYLERWDLFELPFTVFSDRVRIPTALSYARLLGWPFRAALRRWAPSTVVFNIHLHDLVTPSTHSKLPLTYKAVYARNPDGLGLLQNALETLGAQGYSFDLLDEAHDALAVDYSR